MNTEEFAKALLALPQANRDLPWEEQKNMVVFHNKMLIAAHPGGVLLQFNGLTDTWHQIGVAAVEND